MGQAAKNCDLDIEERTPENAMSLANEIRQLRSDVKRLNKENKAEKDYSPTTMYEDYSINEVLFHWQSQSTTSQSSTTGQRYMNHRSMGVRELLFVREFKSVKLGATPYTFLGLADFLSVTGSKPMNITWRLHEPIPAKYLRKTNKLVVG